MPVFFFFNDTATTEIYTLSLHDALPILLQRRQPRTLLFDVSKASAGCFVLAPDCAPSFRARGVFLFALRPLDRKSTRLNSSHANISYAVFCLKKNKQHIPQQLIIYHSLL